MCTLPLCSNLLLLQNNTSLSGASMCTPPFCSDPLHPPAPKITHPCPLLHPYALLYSGLTSCSFSKNNSSPLFGVYWFTPPLCSNVLHPPAPKITHVHSLFHPCVSSPSALLCSDLLHPPTPKIRHLHSLMHPDTLLHSAPTCCTLLL
jgi:hypothetical protein